MFTGIVQTKAQVFAIKNSSNFLHLTVTVAKPYLQNLETGASIAINGVCLTVVAFDLNDESPQVSFDVIDETLAKTNLGSLKEGQFVNFERSLKMGDELGGHIVSGHIQTKAKLINKAQSSDNCQLSFSVESKWHKYLFEKGFIAVNGVSLTLGKVTESQFELHLIPETLARTNLNELLLAEEVNIEFDQQTVTIVATIERYLAEKKV